MVICRGRRPAAAHLRKGTDAERFDTFLHTSREERSDEDVAWILRLMQESGAIDHAYEFAQSLAGAAIHEFETMFETVPDGRDKTFIRDLITWTFRRER